MNVVESNNNDVKNKKKFLLISFFILLVVVAFLVVNIDSYAGDKRATEATGKDIAQIESLVESVKDYPDSPDKDFFYKVVHDGLKDGELQYYEYIDIMDAYSEVNKSEAVF